MNINLKISEDNTYAYVVADNINILKLDKNGIHFFADRAKKFGRIFIVSDLKQSIEKVESNGD